jgi:hypothetical protein
VVVRIAANKAELGFPYSGQPVNFNLFLNDSQPTNKWLIGSN